MKNSLRGKRPAACLFKVAVAALVSLSLLVSCSRPVAEIRFRVTFAVDVNGARKAASTVHALRFRWGGAHGGESIIYADIKGAAPVIDLDENGWLVAATFSEFTEAQGWADRGIAFSDWKYRGKPYSQTCGYAKSFAWMFEETMGITTGEELKPRDDPGELKKRLAAMPKGPQQVLPPRLPAFLWFPRNASFRAAEQICPEEFQRVIGADVALLSVTVEALPEQTPFDERIAEPAPPWLAELRRENEVKPSGRIANDAYVRYHQIEGKSWW